LVFIAFLLDFQYQRDSVKVSWQVCLLCPWGALGGKALNKIASAFECWAGSNRWAT